MLRQSYWRRLQQQPAEGLPATGTVVHTGNWLQPDWKREIKKNNEETTTSSLFPAEANIKQYCSKERWRFTAELQHGDALRNVLCYFQFLLQYIQYIKTARLNMAHGCQTVSCSKAKTSKTTSTPPLYQCSVITLWTAKHGWGLCKNNAVPSRGRLPDSLLIKRLALGNALARSAKICGPQGWGYFYSVYCILSHPHLGRWPAQQQPPLGPSVDEMRCT